MIHMKILIAPLITAARADAAYLITRTLSDLLSYRQNAVAVSTAKASSISSAALYEAAVLKKPRFAAAGLSSYEEWLYSAGAVSEDYLKKDTECLLNAIDHFHPDVIIVIDRIAGVIAARIRGIPCVPLISSSMYRNSSFPARVLLGTNRALSHYGFEQVFRIHRIYDWCIARAVFGPIQLQPLPMEINARRFGTVSVIRSLPEKAEGVYIYFSQLGMKTNVIRKMILDTFEGAPYQVYARADGIESEKHGNIHFLSAMREDLLARTAVCIHDGNDYICQVCACAAVPQLIISDHSYGRTANALAARRYGFGLLADEDDLSVASLYENYRRLISDSRIQEGAEAIRDEIISLGDFEDFYRFLDSIVRAR